MSLPKKKAVVSRKVSDDQIQDANRWNCFIAASALPFEQLTESWLSFFDSQSNPQSASTELVRLVDIAIKNDLENK